MNSIVLLLGDPIVCEARPICAGIRRNDGCMRQVSGVVDGVYSLGGGPEQRAAVLADAEAAAKAQAIKAGADPHRCQVRPAFSACCSGNWHFVPKSNASVFCHLSSEPNMLVLLRL